MRPASQATSEDLSSWANKFPFPEKLSYRVEWRLITAGTVNLDLTRPQPDNWQISMEIDSAGMVARLYRVTDRYKAVSDSKFCVASSDLNAQENKRHVIAHLDIDRARNKLHYQQKDLVKNTATEKDLDVPACTHEIAGALATLRSMNLEPGKSMTIPITDGKKVANAKIEGQARETLSFEGKKYQTIRYEAFLFDNVLYRRKGRLFIWMTDDGERIPVQIRMQLGFPIGNVTIQLEKQERTAG